jgi:hypothetical protein
VVAAVNTEPRDKYATALDEVLALCVEAAEWRCRAHGPDCHCDCLDITDVLAILWKVGADQPRGGAWTSMSEADRDEWRENALTVRGLLDNHAHHDEAMNAALLAVTAERDEARVSEATYLRLAQAAGAQKDRVEAALKAVTRERDEARAAIARVRALHKPYESAPGWLSCERCSHPEEGITITYPCVTVRALDGGAA